MLSFKEIIGATPATLGETASFQFSLSEPPRSGEGILFYMVDTRDGERAYRIHINGTEQCKIVLPRGNNFATLHTKVGHLGQANVLQFESEGPSSPPVDILNIILFY